MPENTSQAAATSSRRKTVIGKVVSTKMKKTIVVEATRTFPHRLYKRVMSRSKKFYAHDEQNSAHLGDFVEIEETRPLSKLKRWRLKEVIRKAALVAETTEPEAQAS